ncbi:MAG: flagellar biosynthetic protein FliO [Candidatus Velthaea sp.]|jgi:flagellar biogenesis protein FliO
MWYVVRGLARGRLVVSTERKLVTVVESTFLAQNVTVHVLKIANKYYLVGGGPGGVDLIDEIPADVVEPWIDGQRLVLGNQRKAVLNVISRVMRR